MKGKIIKNISNQYYVLVDKEVYECRARGKFRLKGFTPLVGDVVDIDVENKYILSIDDRFNELNRPTVVNVDYSLIVTSVKHPDLDLYLLDKLISNAIYSNTLPIICFTKVDLLDDMSEINSIREYYESIGISCVFNTELFELSNLLSGKTVVLCGQTGAGKSSLLNRLDKSLGLKTQEISMALGRGKHTTRHVELFKISDFYVVDTPGFSALDLSDMSKIDIRDTFIDFPVCECKFRDCLHIKEKDCVVKELFDNGSIMKSRYDNYIKFIDEVSK